MTIYLRGAFLSLAMLALAMLARQAQAQCCCCCEDERAIFPPSLWTCCAENPYEERIETDRHDFTQSGRTVGCGVVQLEAGYTYFYNNDDGVVEQAHTTPEMMLRLGLTDGIEFRIRWDYAWGREETEQFDGAEDLRLAFKFAISEQRGWIPTSALEVRSTVPTGGSDWTTDGVQGGLDYIFEWELAPRWVLAASTGVSTNGLSEFGLIEPELGGEDDFILWSHSVALGLPLSCRNELYLEYFYLHTHGREEELTEHYFDAGIDHYVTNNFVLDVRAGIGLNDEADDFFVGVGGGWRY